MPRSVFAGIGRQWLERSDNDLHTYLPAGEVRRVRCRYSCWPQPDHPPSPASSRPPGRCPFSSPSYLPGHWWTGWNRRRILLTSEILAGEGLWSYFRRAPRVVRFAGTGLAPTFGVDVAVTGRGGAPSSRACDASSYCVAVHPYSVRTASLVVAIL